MSSGRRKSSSNNKSSSSSSISQITDSNNYGSVGGGGGNNRKKNDVVVGSIISASDSNDSTEGGGGDPTVALLGGGERKKQQKPAPPPLTAAAVAATATTAFASSKSTTAKLSSSNNNNNNNTTNSRKKDNKKQSSRSSTAATTSSSTTRDSSSSSRKKKRDGLMMDKDGLMKKGGKKRDEDDDDDDDDDVEDVPLSPASEDDEDDDDDDDSDDDDDDSDDDNSIHNNDSSLLSPNSAGTNDSNQITNKYTPALASPSSRTERGSSATGNNNASSNHEENDDNDNSDDDDDDDDDDGPDEPMSMEELLYSSSSYYAIARPVTITMVLAALAVVYINTDDTIANGQEAMTEAYQVWNINSSNGNGENLMLSLANALVMVSVICAMTFGIVILYKFKFMKCLIGYMVMTSATLLGVLGANMASTFLTIYNIPVDKISFCVFMFNFAVVGVLAVFWGQGIPKYITQAYLIATSVILAWHLSYFDDWTTWSLLFMLAVYDLCAVLTPCGPLKALVNLMSEDDAPEMPGLLFEAQLPPEAKRPGNTPKSKPRSRSNSVADGAIAAGVAAASAANPDTSSSPLTSTNVVDPGHQIKIPLAIAKVYQLPVVAIPDQSMHVLGPDKISSDSLATSGVSASPLLSVNRMYTDSVVALPDNPTVEQLRAMVIVRLPSNGGKLEQVARRSKKVYLERDRYGNPKRLVWVDRKGKVFAEMREDDEDGPERNSIRLGLGDFIFYSVLVSKAAQHSFTTFAACTLVILSGLGGTLVLLSVYHHALPALPISIFLGVIFYLITRTCTEPWIEHVLARPYYV